MILNLGGKLIDLGDDILKAAYPLVCGDCHLLVGTVVRPIEDDELLSGYACGDMLNGMGQLVASAQSPTPCLAPAVNKITMSVHAEVKGQEGAGVSKCVSVACEEHTLVIMTQIIFISGIMAAYRMEAQKRGETDTEDIE